MKASLRNIEIGNQTIGEQYPCYVIAEIGVNHNGEMDLAYRLIDAAKSAGANAVKFQTFKAEALVLKSAPKAQYQQSQTGDGSQLDMISKLELSFDQFRLLANYCEQQSIDFISTAFDAESLDWVIKLGPPCLKWPSGELTNVSLLRQAASAGLPVLLSTGMATLAEVDKAVTILRDFDCPFAVLQCVSNYPARIEDQNLRTLPAMAAIFDCPVGFSDHTNSAYAAIAARALGMSVLEKHITLDCGMTGPDHSASMEPDEFTAMIAALRAVEVGLGDGVKRPIAAEANVRSVARKSLVYSQELPAGHILSEKDMVAKRPASGVGPENIDLLVGMRLTASVNSDDFVKFSDFSDI